MCIRDRYRASRETEERLKSAAADAAKALAAEVERVSNQLRAEHEKAQGAAARAEREAAEVRHESALRKAEALRREQDEQQVPVVGR